MFFKVCCTDYDRTLLAGFPLYWVKKLEFKKPRTLEELTPHDRELCQVLASLGVVFNTAQLIKHKFSPADLKDYIGTCLYTFLTPTCVSLVSLHILSFIFAFLACLLAYYYTCIFCPFMLICLPFYYVLLC